MADLTADRPVSDQAVEAIIRKPQEAFDVDLDTRRDPDICQLRFEAPEGAMEVADHILGVIQMTVLCHVGDDASTTAYHLLPLLAGFQNLLVITNGAKTALEAAAMGIRTICTGGEMTPESFSYVGTDAEAVLRRYNAHVAFFSCRGLSEDGAVTDNSILENAARRIMLDNARESYLLCDKSKHGTRHLNTLCHVKDLVGVISED